jgi:mannose-6-phosphate isomerase-like protein (cupin superfamily)
MKILLGKTLLLATLAAFAAPAGAKAGNQPAPAVTKEIFKLAEKNSNWKKAFETGTQMQIVFMNVSPATSPANEIGMEKHPFDQVIFIVEGEGEAVLNGKKSPLKEGNMIFIPKGTEHNVINTDKDGELKVASFYSQNDIPAGSVYKTKADEPVAD